MTRAARIRRNMAKAYLQRNNYSMEALRAVFHDRDFGTITKSPTDWLFEYDASGLVRAVNISSGEER